MTKGRIAAAHGRFNCIRQIAPMCPPTRAHRRNLANMIELVFPRPTGVHNLNRKSIGSAIFAQLTAEYHRSCPGISSLIITRSHGGSKPHLIPASLGPPESITQTVSRSMQPFSRSSRQNVVGHVRACPSPKLPLPMGDLYPKLLRGSLVPPRLASQTASRSVQLFLQGLLL